MFKIDYYDLGLNFASPDPADLDVIHRIMTIMRAENIEAALYGQRRGSPPDIWYRIRAGWFYH